MGAYNSGDKIKKAIESIIAQSFTDWELIICDDASTDNTYEIIKSYTVIDKRIILIQNKTNKGLAQTLNECLKICRGEYVGRMDDDDYSVPDRFTTQNTFLDQNLAYDFVCSQIECYNETGNWLPKNRKKEKPEKRDFLFGSCFVHPTLLIRKTAILSVQGYRVTKETKRTEDYDLFMRLYANGYKGYNLDLVLLHYYVSLSAMKKRKFGHKIDEAIVRYKGFKMLGLMPQGILYVIKPIVVGLIPGKLLFLIKKKIGLV